MNRGKFWIVSQLAWNDSRVAYFIQKGNKNA